MTAHPFRLSETRRKRVAYALTVCVAAAILVLALVPLPAAPSVPGSDKTHHFIAFAALVCPVALIYPRALWWALPLAVSEAGLIEIVQPYVNRMREWADFTAGVKGALAGAAAGLALHYAARATTTKTVSDRSGKRL